MTRLHPGFRSLFARSSMARLSSILAYWSTPLWPVVLGAISEVIKSNFQSQSRIQKSEFNIFSIFSDTSSYSKISHTNVRTFGFLRDLIGWRSNPITRPSDPSVRLMTWSHDHGADAISRIRIPGWIRWKCSSIWRSLYALLAR